MKRSLASLIFIVHTVYLTEMGPVSNNRL